MKILEEENIELKRKLQEAENMIKDLMIQSRNFKKSAEFDFLTQVTNRLSFTRSLKDFHEDFKHRDYPYALLYLDIDNFKSINDTFSHSVGDKVLIEVANKLVLSNRAHTVIGRLGGEEFGVLIPGITADIAETITQRMQNSIKNIFLPELESRTITLSIGIYLPDKNDLIEDCLYKADKAMYYSKQTGKDRYTFFSKELIVNEKN